MTATSTSTGDLWIFSASAGRQDYSLAPTNPNEDKTATIECQLFNYTLGEGTHLYEALSYVWGNQDEKVPILIGEHYFEVTRNLHTALLRLRNHFFERIVWVDAVCIDQGNRLEKGRQIQHMTEIYHQASRVIVWLGEGTDKSNQAIEDKRNAAENEGTNPLERSNQQEILERRRIWVREHSNDLCSKVLKTSI